MKPLDELDESLESPIDLKTNLIENINKLIEIKFFYKNESNQTETRNKSGTLAEIEEKIKDAELSISNLFFNLFDDENDNIQITIKELLNIFSSLDLNKYSQIESVFTKLTTLIATKEESHFKVNTKQLKIIQDFLIDLYINKNLEFELKQTEFQKLSAKLEKKAKHWQTQLNSINDEKLDLETRLKGSENLAASLNKVKKELKSENNYLHSQISDLNSTINKFYDEDSADSIHKENQSLKNKLLELNKITYNLNSKIENITKELENSCDLLKSERIAKTQLEEQAKETTEQLREKELKLNNSLIALTLEVDSQKQISDEKEKQYISKITALHKNFKEETSLASKQHIEIQRKLKEQITLLENKVRSQDHLLISRNKQIVTLEQNKSLSELNIDSFNPENINMAEKTSKELAKKIGELFSREDKKSIPIFKGQSDDRDINDWLKEAERIAQNNEWDDGQRVRFFSDRLKGEALDWHLEFKSENPVSLYSEWREAFKTRFSDPADLERLREKLNSLKQKPGQRTKAFVAKINSLFISLYGKDPIHDDCTDYGRKELIAEIVNLRDKDRKKILLRGLLPKFKAELWSRMTVNPTYRELCELAYTTENVVINRELNEEIGINEVMEHQEKLLDKALSVRDTEIKLMKEQLKNLQLSQSLSQGSKDINHIAVTDERQSRSLVAGRHSQHVQFDGHNTPSNSREPSTTRQQSKSFDNKLNRNYSKDRHRDHSKDRFHSRPSQPEHHNRFHQDQDQDQCGHRQQYTQQGQTNSYSRHNQDRQNYQNPPNNSYFQIFCRFCKKNGHTIEECRKLLNQQQNFHRRNYQNPNPLLRN